MNRKYISLIVTIVATLALSLLAGCASQPASQASSSAADAAASSAEATSEATSEAPADQAAAEKTQDEIIAELNDSLAKVPAYSSVTVTEHSLSWTNDGEDGDNDLIESDSIYKFDESGDKVKTCVTYKMEDIELTYYTDGNDAVCVTDGPVYSGTVDQFFLEYAAGSDTYLKETIGDLNSIVSCAAEVSQGEIEGVMGYELTLDPEKYIATDEILQMLADEGDPVKESYVTVGFSKDGRIAWMTKTDVFDQITKSTLIDLTDYDSTVVDAMPEATHTYEEMEADIAEKQEKLNSEL